MELKTQVDGNKATIAVEGKLSVATAPDLEAEVQDLPESVNEIYFDLSKLEYISSAGLRVLVATQKLTASRGGSITLAHLTDEVAEVFDMTGLADVMTIVD